MTYAPTPVALITGAARRIGASLARELHHCGFNLILHYRQSHQEAQALARVFNELRPDSVITLQADLNRQDGLQSLADRACHHWQRLDALINNASAFYPTPIGTATEQEWDDLMGSNLKAPFFLSQALLKPLRHSKGCIINIADVYASRPLKDHTIYSIAKAGNVMLTQSLARELAPDIRVNGIAPGAILWPESPQQDNADYISDILHKIPLNRRGHADDIARTARFLITEAPYVTGQIIAVDGGRSIHI